MYLYKYSNKNFFKAMYWGRGHKIRFYLLFVVNEQNETNFCITFMYFTTLEGKRISVNEQILRLRDNLIVKRSERIINLVSVVHKELNAFNVFPFLYVSSS